MAGAIAGEYCFFFHHDFVLAEPLEPLNLSLARRDLAGDIDPSEEVGVGCELRGTVEESAKVNLVKSALLHADFGVIGEGMIEHSGPSVQEGCVGCDPDIRSRRKASLASRSLWGTFAASQSARSWLFVPDKLGREQALEARLIIEDVKGRDPRGDTALSKLKIKIFEALYRAQGFRVTIRQAEGY